MKKTIALLLAAALMLCASSCAKEKPASGDETSPAETSAVSETTEPVTEETTTQKSREPDASVLAIYEKYGYTVPDYSLSAILPETEPADDAYMESIVYLCDSTLYHLYSKDLVERSRIWTGKEYTQTLDYQDTVKILDTTDNTEHPIREMARIHKPERMVICLGTNGIDWMSPDDVYDEFCDLIKGIKEASPDTEIIIQSIMPMTPDMYGWSRASFDNAKITACNAKVLKAAADSGVRYLDTFSVLIGENGLLKEEYSSDGLHLTKEGLEAVLDYIRTHSTLEE